jgi:hypothetical protein
VRSKVVNDGETLHIQTTEGRSWTFSLQDGSMLENSKMGVGFLAVWGLLIFGLATLIVVLTFKRRWPQPIPESSGYTNEGP